MEKRTKVGFVVSRFGEDVVGGAEFLTRKVVEHMVRYWDIDVITTKANDYFTWKNEYHKTMEMVNGVNVIRFDVDQERNMEEFNKWSPVVFACNHSVGDEKRWMELQGPLSSGLVNYISNNRNKYDIFIFVQYLYGPTYYAMPLVWGKSILWPCAHNEPSLFLEIMKDYFIKPRGIIFNTIEEMGLVNSTFGNRSSLSEIIGVGVDSFTKNEFKPNNVKSKYGLSNPYILYVGRIEGSKGCSELFEYFKLYKGCINKKLDLVLVGKALMDIPKRKDIKYLSYVSEQDKFSLISGCEFLVNPSIFESFSIVIMEAWLKKITVLVNGRCDVMVGHCKRSNGGLWFENFDDFEQEVRWLLENKEKRQLMGENGKKYVLANFSWDIIEKKLKDFVELNLNKIADKSN